MGILPDLDEALAILEPMLDVVTTRPTTFEPPEWVARRGWAFLEELDDEELFRAERDPARWLSTHPTFDALGRRILALTDRYETSASVMGSRRRHVKKRKAAQVAAFCAVAEQHFADVERIVDLGSGHGHLTRALDETIEPRESVGIDREPLRVLRANALGGRFVIGDGDQVELRSGDLVVGLHPCGELGDALVRRARESNAHALMVSCCFQKISAPSRSLGSLSIPRVALGLANLSPRSFEGSESLDAKRRARRIRLALRLALEKRGVRLAAGDEARGLTKERIRRGLRAAADAAFARRGLELASDDELDDAMERARRLHGRIARYALPRHALARVLELAIVLDRAHRLEVAGWDVLVRPVFGRGTSPRNLAVIARAPEKKV